MKINILEAVNEIIEIATDSLNNIVKVQYVVNEDDIDTEKAKDFPALYIMVTTPSTLNDNFNIANITLYFLDASTAREDEYLKDLNIKSDLFQQASILLDLLQLNGSIQNINNTLEPFAGRFNNGLSGWSTSLAIEIKKPCYNI